MLTALLLSAAPLGRAAEQQPPQSPNQPPPGGEVIPSPNTPVPLASIEPIIDEVVVEAAQPRYVAPTLRDSIGRIWAPVQ